MIVYLGEVRDVSQDFGELFGQLVILQDSSYEHSRAIKVSGKLDNPYVNYYRCFIHLLKNIVFGKTKAWA